MHACNTAGVASKVAAQVAMSMGVVVWLSVLEGGGYKSVLSYVGAKNISRVTIVEGDVEEHSILVSGV